MTSYHHYPRFERAESPEPTETGLKASLHGESLRIDVISDDVVRIKISRGGVFDENPTYAVDADAASVRVDFSVETIDGFARLTTSALTVTLRTAPFRIDIHRADGSVVFETGVNTGGQPSAYATLNDAFVLERRYEPGDAIYGLGQKTGSQNRRGRKYHLWNADVPNPNTAREFAAELAEDDPTSDPSSTEFDPYYMSIPFYYQQDAATGSIAASFIDNGYRAEYDFTGSLDYRIHFSGGQYTEYIFAGPDMPGILEAYTWLTGRTALPPLWALGHHQCRWKDYDQEQLLALAARFRELNIPTDGLWLDIEHMDCYRVFTWNEELFPDIEGMLAGLADDGFRVITIVDPGVKSDPGYEVYDSAVARDVLCKTEGGGTYIGQVWPGDTAFPDFATEEGRRWWGELNAQHVQSGLAGIWNDMNEPATGSISPQAMRFDHGRHSHERFHNQYAC